MTIGGSDDSNDGINDKALKKCVEKKLRDAKKAEDLALYPAPAIETGTEKYMKAWGKNDTREGFAGAIMFTYPYNGKQDYREHGVDLVPNHENEEAAELAEDRAREAKEEEVVCGVAEKIV